MGTTAGKSLSAKDVSDRWKPIVGLVGWKVVDMRRARKIGRLIGDVPRERVRVVSPSECLAERRRLNHPLVGKLFVGGSNDAQSGRRASLARTAQPRGLGREMTAIILILGVIRTIALGRLLM